MQLTTRILTDNGFVLFDDLYTITVDTTVISFDSFFHIILNESTYPIVTTVEEANARFVSLEIDLTLV